MQHHAALNENYPKTTDLRCCHNRSHDHSEVFQTAVEEYNHCVSWGITMVFPGKSWKWSNTIRMISDWTCYNMSLNDKERLCHNSYRWNQKAVRQARAGRFSLTFPWMMTNSYKFDTSSLYNVLCTLKISFNIHWQNQWINQNRFKTCVCCPLSVSGVSRIRQDHKSQSFFVSPPSMSQFDKQHQLSTRTIDDAVINYNGWLTVHLYQD